MKLIKSTITALGLLFTVTACAGNKESKNQNMKGENMEIVHLTKAEFLKKVTMKPIPMTGNMKVTNRLLLISMLHGAALARHWHPYWKSWQKNMPERFIFIR